MRRIWTVIAILLIVCISARPAAAQEDEPVPPYATVFNLEQSVENLTVRVLWASADEAGFEVAWRTDYDLQQTGWRWDEQILHNGVQLRPYLDRHMLDYPMSISPVLTFAVLRPAGIDGDESITIELRLVGTKVTDSRENVSNPETKTMTFMLNVPFYRVRRWQGEQAVTMNGITLILNAVEYLPSETRLTFCYPRMFATNAPVPLEFAPFIDNPDVRTEVYPVGVRYSFGAQVDTPRPTKIPMPEITPESTDELGRPIYPTSTLPPIPTLTPEMCVDFGIPGLTPDEEGTLHIVIDELRTAIIPTPENVALLNTVLEETGSSWRTFYDPRNGFGMSSPDAEPTSPRFHEWRVFWNLVSDITSERLFGPWVFDVPLDE